VSDIGGIFTPLDLLLMALGAGSPNLVLGAVSGAMLKRDRRIIGAALGGAAGFALCCGAVLLWVTVLK
jgi:hypothetical protein